MKLVQGIEKHWKTKGELTPKQADAIADISKQVGIACLAENITGKSDPEWIQQCMTEEREEKQRQIAEREREWELHQQKTRAKCRDALPEIKAAVLKMEASIAKRKPLLDIPKNDLNSAIVPAIQQIQTRCGLSGALNATNVRQAIKGDSSIANRVAVAILLNAEPSELWPGISHNLYCMSFSFDRSDNEQADLYSRLLACKHISSLGQRTSNDDLYAEKRAMIGDDIANAYKALASGQDVVAGDEVILEAVRQIDKALRKEEIMTL